MSKGQILLGKQRGKVGGFVARVDSGVGQVLSEYNPHPKNPRTLAQTMQRAKMNLAGQISKVVPAECIVGLDTNGRKARSKFVSNLLNSIVVGESSPMTASMAYALLKFSKGVTEQIAVTATYDSEVPGVEVELNFEAASEKCIGAMVIALEHTSNDRNFVMAPVFNYVVLEKTATIVNYSFTQASQVGDPAVMDIYIVPIVETSSNVRAAFGAMIAGAADMKATASRTIAAAQGYGESVAAAEVPLTA